jgi:predicted acylesterase/phospholipase RssA/outer membrane translocation and assembly module TamA
MIGNLNTRGKLFVLVVESLPRLLTFVLRFTSRFPICRLICLCVLCIPTAILSGGSFSFDFADLTPRTIKSALSRNVKGYKVGIALSGGGARGFAHLGVLEELEKNGIQIDIVTGTSMGGIIGGLYATGMPPHQIEKVAREIDWSSFFSDAPGRGSLLLTRRTEIEGELLTVRFDHLTPQIPTALSSGQKLVNVLNSLTLTSTYFSQGDFANFDRKLGIVATDIVAGERVVFERGSLAEALRATMGVPLAFTPMEQGNRLLMDGGLLEPIPTRTARQLGADFVIAVDATSDLLTIKEIVDPVDIANQTTTILSTEAKKRLLEEADFVITPALSDISATAFDKAEVTVARGREAAVQRMVELKDLLAHKTDSCRTVIIDSVSFTDTIDHRSETVISAMNAIRAFAGKTVRTVQIDEALHRLFQTGEFAKVDDSLATGASSILVIRTTPFPVIRKLTLDGNQVFDDSTLTRASGFSDSRVNSISRLREVTENLIALYQYHGYDLAQVKGARLDTATMELTVVVDEGKIAGITVEGNEKTRWWVVSSYFPLSSGQFYSKFAAARGVQQIYSCGLYDNVNLRLDERSGGVWITINVKEKKFGYARIGGRYHEEFHPEVFLKFGHANLFGTGNEASAYAKFSERRKLYQLQLRADRIVRTMATYNLRFYYANDKIGLFADGERISFRTDKRWGVRISVGQQLAREGLFDITARWEQVRFQYEGEKSSTERRLGSLQFKAYYDTKDRFTLPTSGEALAASFEIASDILATDENYRKLEGSAEGYYHLTRKLNLHPRVSVGWSQDGLPIYEKFYLGGSRAFYGYLNDQLVGDKYFLTNSELRLGPIYSFYLSVRYDAGQVFGRLDDVRVNRLRHAFGVALILDTPMGPFSIGYGRAERRYGNLYLNLGFDF